MLLTAMLVCTLSGCAAPGGVGAPDGQAGGPAPLRGFGVAVDEAVAPRVPLVHVRVCGDWGCHEQDVPLHISGPVSALPCPSEPAAADTACGVAQLPGPGPGYGYAPVPRLTADPVTVTVTTPPGAPLTITAELVVHPSMLCPGGAPRPSGATSRASAGTPRASAGTPGGTPRASAGTPGANAGTPSGTPRASAGTSAGTSRPSGGATTCAGGAPQAELRIAADGTVSQSR